jgi:hypothetical protein
MHSPAPWSAKQTAVYTQVVDAGGDLVCFLGIREPEMAKANAALICSSVDMRNAIDVAREFLMAAKFGEQCKYSLDEAIEVLDAASN